MDFKEYLREAAEIKFTELPPEKKKFFSKHFKTKPNGTFDGIHGFVASFPSHGNTERLTKESLKKLINDKNFRWLDISSVGF